MAFFKNSPSSWSNSVGKLTLYSCLLSRSEDDMHGDLLQSEMLGATTCTNTFCQICTLAGVQLLAGAKSH